MNKPKNIPELRFPEFVNKEPWAERKLSDVLFEHKEKSTGKEEVYSVSVHKGVINQVEHLGRVFAASNTENYKRVLPGDIIYTKSPTGNFPFGIIKQSKVSKPVIVSPLYGIFKPETTDLGFILDAYFEYPERTINYLSSIVQKGAKNTININNDTFLLKSLVLPFDKKEQKKIASCLSSLDDVIAAHSQKLDLLKDHKRGLIQNLFPKEGETLPKYRFPEFVKDGEWVNGQVGDLVNTLMGNAFKSEDFEENGIQLVRMGNLYQGDLQLNRTPVFLPVRFKEEYSKFLIKPLDILMSMTGTLGKRDYGFVIQTPKNCPNLLLNQRVLKIIPKRNCIKEFILQLMKDDFFLEKLYSLPGGTKQANLSVNQLNSIAVSFPSIEEQQKIASCLSSLDEIITAQAGKIEQLKLHKKGLMQRLFPKMND